MLKIGFGLGVDMKKRLRTTKETHKRKHEIAVIEVATIGSMIFELRTQASVHLE